MKTLYVTYCSGKKNSIDEGTPEQLYDSQRIADFIAACKSKGHDWAILSAKYGLFLPFEVKKNYDVAFKSVAYECRIIRDGRVLAQDESRKHFAQLVQQVRRCVLENGIEKLVFYCKPPLKRRKCYLHVLHAGVDGCEIVHDNWADLVDHIEKMFSDRVGRIRIVTALKD